MNVKTLLASMAVMASASAFAATYYVTPDGAGTKDGSSWNDAFGVSEFRTQAGANVNGDVYNFAGGLYNLSAGTVVFKLGTGATLTGNAEGERTIFSGDKNGNNNPENGDANRLIRFQAQTKDGDSSNAIVVNSIDFTCVFTYADNDTTSMAAFAVNNSGDVLVKDCRFYNNWAQGQRGGPAAFIFRSTVKFDNCMFYNNSANYRGGAIRIYSDNVDKGKVTLENCVVKNNKNYHNLGGAIFMGHGNSLNIVNSTITGNTAQSDGAAVYHNGYSSAHHCELRIVNSTIANNVTTNAGDAQIVSTQSAHLNIANSIVTSNDSVAAFMYKGTEANNAFAVVSGGYNYVGRIIDAVEHEIDWLATDRQGDECSYSAIFGENKLNSNNVIVPENFYLGATGAQVTEAVSSWGLPAGLDLTVDQLGNTRAADMTPGAYAVTEDLLTSSIAIPANDKNAPRLVSLGAGLYAVDGVAGRVNVYSVNGAVVLAADAGKIDLSNLSSGVYFIQSGNTSFKVIK